MQYPDSRGHIDVETTLVCGRSKTAAQILIRAPWGEVIHPEGHRESQMLYGLPVGGKIDR
jgi:hypothetical protein